jgi:hypothetical protein
MHRIVMHPLKSISDLVDERFLVPIIPDADVIEERDASLKISNWDEIKAMANADIDAEEAKKTLKKRKSRRITRITSKRPPIFRKKR